MAFLSKYYCLSFFSQWWMRTFVLEYAQTESKKIVLHKFSKKRNQEKPTKWKVDGTKCPKRKMACTVKRDAATSSIRRYRQSGSERIVRNRRKSVRRTSIGTQILRTTLWCVVRKRIRTTPYNCSSFKQKCQRKAEIILFLCKKTWRWRVSCFQWWGHISNEWQSQQT